MTFQSFEGQKKNRPEIKFEIYQSADKGIWKMFSKYHYLSHSHNNAANVYVAMVNDQIAGFISILHLPHPKAKNIKKVHRLVILPDYQGIGIGGILLNHIADIYKKDKWRFSIVTSAPSLIYSLKNSNEWICRHFGRMVASTGVIHGNANKSNNSKDRITASFEKR
jgi:GNAT superfamily N-acetyltransferase